MHATTRAELPHGLGLSQLRLVSWGSQQRLSTKDTELVMRTKTEPCSSPCPACLFGLQRLPCEMGSHQNWLMGSLGYLNENSLKLQVLQASEMPSQDNEQTTGLFWGFLQSGSPVGGPWLGGGGTCL